MLYTVALMIFSHGFEHYAVSTLASTVSTSLMTTSSKLNQYLLKSEDTSSTSSHPVHSVITPSLCSLAEAGLLEGFYSN